MRRLFVLLGLALVFALPATAAAHAPTKRCSISVDPGSGGPRDVYRITGRHFPLPEEGLSLRVRIHIFRVVIDEPGVDGLPKVSLKLKHLSEGAMVPGGHYWRIDFSALEYFPENPRLRPGHYLVTAQALEQAGCRTSTSFHVVRGG
jgi:hypothetical protein